MFWTLTEIPQVVYKQLFQRLRVKMSNGDRKQDHWSEEEQHYTEEEITLCVIQSQFKEKFLFFMTFWDFPILLQKKCQTGVRG